MPSSFLSPLYWRISSTTGCLVFIDSRTSSDVTYCPVFVFLGLSITFSLSNSTSPTCLGERMLKLYPVWEKICSSMDFILSVNRCDVSFSDSRSILTPFLSIYARTRTSGISIFLNRSVVPSFSSSLSRIPLSCMVTSASSQAYSYICSGFSCDMFFWFFPLGPMSSSI